jgi:fructose-specific phosphotransferase system IIC component
VAGWLTVRLAGWLAGCLASWLAGWLAGWLAAWKATPLDKHLIDHKKNPKLSPTHSNKRPIQK